MSQWAIQTLYLFNFLPTNINDITGIRNFEVGTIERIFYALINLLKHILSIVVIVLWCKIISRQ
jgi:hypothetical protein